MPTVKEAAARLEISPSLVYALCASGVLRHTRYGKSGRRGCIRISEEELTRYETACQKGGEAVRAQLVLRHIR